MSESAGKTMDYNTKIIQEFRANQGRVGGPWEGFTLIVIHHIGVKSGIERVTPLGCYLIDDDHIAIWASNGGSPTHPAWYYNVKASPTITIEVGPETFPALVRELAGAERAVLWQKLIERYPNLGEAQNRTTRQFPVFLLTRQT